MNKTAQTIRYILADLLAAGLAWFLLFLFRKDVIEASKHGYMVPIQGDHKLIAGLLALPVLWVCFYALTGFYRNIYRRSRLREVWQTLITTLTGGLIIFFTLMLDDSIQSYRDYYYTLGAFWTLHFVFTATGRLILSTRTNNRIQRREIGFRAILVGSNEKAADLYRELESSKISNGLFFQGYVTVNGENDWLKGVLPCLGTYRDLPAAIHENAIEEVVVAVDNSEHVKLSEIMNIIQNEDVFLKMMPDMYSIVMGMVKMNNILGAVLIEVDFEVMPPWQKSAKRIFDILFSLFALIICLPVFLVLSIIIVATDKGPVFFRQERIGYKGRPFRIIKFRSMRMDAEKFGPQLSKENDPRITPIGRILRKTRLDELPQFINVLIGDMSVVGPRPERLFFIDQIVQKAPHYRRLHRVKPGITSWGQVKFGYAENVDQMVERLKYDILYIENMNIALDIKILIYTVLIMVQGRGK